MSCLSVPGGCVCCAGEEHEIVVEGRPVRFEFSERFGPLVLRTDSMPRARQPGPRSKFWPVFECWLEERS